MKTIKTSFKYKISKNLRRTEWLLILLALPFVIATQPDVKGSYVVAGVKSRIEFTYGDEFYQFDTYKTELMDAVSDQGIVTYDQDLFSVPRDTRLVGQEVKLVVTKSLPVVINDENEHIIGRTIYSSPEKILEQNKIRYYPEDRLTIELITDPISEGGVGQLVTIKRAPVYEIKVDDKTKEVRTWDSQVSDIVAKSKTKLNPNDIVTPGLKSRLLSGATIKITRINYADTSEIKTIPYETVYQGSTSLALGQERAVVSGIVGSKKLTYRVTYKNGEEVSRVLAGSKITKVKRNAKILRGAVTGKCKWGPYYETNNGPYTTAFHYPGYLGRFILVTNLSNGKSVKVEIVDKGPTNGLLDLSTTAIEKIGGLGGINLNGYFNVMVQLL